MGASFWSGFPATVFFFLFWLRSVKTASAANQKNNVRLWCVLGLWFQTVLFFVVSLRACPAPAFSKNQKTLPRTNSTRAVFPTRFWDGFVGALQRGCGPWAKIFRNWKTHVFLKKGNWRTVARRCSPHASTDRPALNRLPDPSSNSSTMSEEIFLHGAL